VAESRIRVPWILSGSNGARIDVITSREELAALLGGEIKQALHPVFAAVYLADRDGQLLVYPNAPATGFPPLLSRTPLLEELARRNEPWQISDIDTREAGYPTI